MKIDVRRKTCMPDRTLSDIYIDGKFFCYGMEDTFREIKTQPVKAWKKFGCTAIPEGCYRVVMNWSNRFSRQMLEILQVPGYSGVRIHNGKGPESTDGCLLVSMTKEFNFSRVAMLEIERLAVEAMVRKEEVLIEFSGGVHNVQ